MGALVRPKLGAQGAGIFRLLWFWLDRRGPRVWREGDWTLAHGLWGPLLLQCRSVRNAVMSSDIQHWTASEVAQWCHTRLMARFPGALFGEVLTRMEKVHLLDGPMLLQLNRSEWQEAVPPIGPRMLLIQEVQALRQHLPQKPTEPVRETATGNELLAPEDPPPLGDPALLTPSLDGFQRLVTGPAASATSCANFIASHMQHRFGRDVSTTEGSGPDSDQQPAARLRSNAAAFRAVAGLKKTLQRSGSAWPLRRGLSMPPDADSGPTLEPSAENALNVRIPPPPGAPDAQVSGSDPPLCSLV